MSNLLATATAITFDAESAEAAIIAIGVAYGAIILGAAYLVARFGSRRGGWE